MTILTMQQLATTSVKKATLYIVIAMAVLIGSNSIITGSTAAMTTMNSQKESDALIASAKEELQRRIDELKTSSAELEKATFSSEDIKNNTIAENKAVTQRLVDLQQKLNNATTPAEAQTQITEIEKLYAMYQMANVKTTSLTNSDSQTDAKDNLEKTANNIGAQIGQAKSEGKDTANAEEMLAQINSLITSIAAVIASVQALITSLLAGDVAGALKIMESIISQLGINSDVIGSVSEMLGSLTNITGSLQIGA